MKLRLKHLILLNTECPLDMMLKATSFILKVSMQIAKNGVLVLKPNEKSGSVSMLKLKHVS